MFTKRSGTWLFMLTAFLGCSTLSAVAEEANEKETTWSKPVNGLSARVVLVKYQVTNGTTRIFANLEVWNVSKQPLFLDWSSERMKYAVMDGKGKDAPRPTFMAYGGAAGRAEKLVLPPGKKGELEMTAGGMGIRGNLAGLIDLGPTDCWELPTSEIDYYFKAVLEIPEGTTADSDAAEPWLGRIELPLVLVPLKKQPLPKDAATGKLIDELGAKMVNMPFRESNEVAERALSLIDDPRVVPWYIKAIQTDRSTLRQSGLDRLAYFNSDLALEGIKLGMQTQGEDLGDCTTSHVAYEAAGSVRHYASIALAKSTHPKAKELLLTMRHDSDYGVRLKVLQTLYKSDNPEVLEALQTMRKDSNEMVRGEAERLLKNARN